MICDNQHPFAKNFKFKTIIFEILLMLEINHESDHPKNLCCLHEDDILKHAGQSHNYFPAKVEVFAGKSAYYPSIY